MPDRLSVCRALTLFTKSQEREAWLHADLSLLKIYGKFNGNWIGADAAYFCKHSACLHTQKCAQNVTTEITIVSQQWIN